MTNWPTAPVDTANVDDGNDNPRLARADIDDAFTKLNKIIEGPAVFETRAGLAAATVPANVPAVETGGHTTKGDGGAARYIRVGAEPTHAFKVQSADGAWWEGVYVPGLSAAAFGAIPSAHGSAPGASSSAALQDFFTYIDGIDGDRVGGVFTIPPGAYLIDTQIDFIQPQETSARIMAHGVEWYTTGAISALKVRGSAGKYGTIIEGLQIVQVNDTDATFGIEIENAWNYVFRHISIKAGGNNAAYAGIRVGQSDNSNNSTGAIWGRFENCRIRKGSGASGNVPIGIQLEGSVNANTLSGLNFNNVDRPIRMTFADSATGALPNALVVEGCWFENFDIAITIIFNSNSPAQAAGGLRVYGNRFEKGNRIISIPSGHSSTITRPPFFFGNYYDDLAFTAGFSANPDGHPVNTLEANNHVSTFEISVAHSGYRLLGIGVNDDPLTLRPSGANKGLSLEKDTGAEVAFLDWLGSGGVGDEIGLGTNTAARMKLSGVRSISRGTTRAENLRGSVTFATSGTASVSFGTAEPNATYFLAISGNANETFWVTGKGTGGFTANSSNASSTATLDWILIR